MKACKSLINSLNNISNKVYLFSIPISFKYNSKKSYNTLFDKILTFLIYGFLIYYFYSLVHEMIYKTSQTINNYTYHDSTDTEIKSQTMDDYPIFFHFQAFNAWGLKPEQILNANIDVRSKLINNFNIIKCSTLETSFNYTNNVSFQV